MVEDDKVLMVNHRMHDAGVLWSPPGGGLNFGEHAVECLKREIREETGLEADVLEFLFACEYIGHPLHAVELFFSVVRRQGTLTTGFDPEAPATGQIIRDVRFLSFGEIIALPPGQRHGVFSHAKNTHDLLELRGFLTV